MDSALAWIGEIVQWIGRFIPRREILDTTVAAIKFKNGNEPTLCGPGVHWYWPWKSTWLVYPTARQSDRLESQVMESKDGKTFLVSGTLTYEIDDLMKLIPRTHSATVLTQEIAMTAVHDVCCTMDWAILQIGQREGTLKTKLKNAAQRELGEYGIRVVRLKLNTLARCRVLRIAQSVSSEE